MAFSKFDPHREPGPSQDEGRNPQAVRRARILRYAWWISVVYTAIGFAFLGVFYFWGNLF